MPRPFFTKTDHRVYIKISVRHVRGTGLLKTLSQNDFRGSFEEWKTHMERCVSSGGNYSEGDNMVL